MRERECRNCGSAVPGGTGFCPECGRPLEETAGLRGGSFLRGRQLGTRDAVLLLAAVVAVGAAFLLVGGERAWGAVVLVAAIALAVGRSRLAARRARLVVSAVLDRRAKVTAAGEALVARSREQVVLFRSRRELAELEAKRERLFHHLGYAVYHGDEPGAGQARAALDAAATRAGSKEEEIEALKRETEERVRRAQARVRPTERLQAAGHTPYAGVEGDARVTSTFGRP